MKKRFRLLLILMALLALCAPALAEGGFTLDENATIAGMNYLPWARGYEPTSDGETMTVCLPLRSDTAVGRITAALTVDDETVSPLRGEGAKIDVLPDQNGLYAVRLSARLLSGRINGDYAATVRVTGKDADGAAVTASFPVVLRVRDGKSSGAAMRPSLEGVSADLRVGEDGALTATLVNTDPYAEMRDILLTVSDASGEILNAGSDKLRLGSLMPGERAAMSYPLSVQPDAAVKAHALNLTLTWTALGEAMSWTETYALSVTQEIRLEHGAMQAAASVVAGDTAVLTLPLMNMGRGELRNVLATLTLPGLCERQSVLVGTIAPGESAQARLSFAADGDAGTYTGVLRVTGEDAWGNESGYELPVELAVEPKPVKSAEDTASGGAGEEKMLSPLVWGLGGGCALLLAALIVTSALLVRKIHRLEEDRL